MKTKEKVFKIWGFKLQLQRISDLSPFLVSFPYILQKQQCEQLGESLQKAQHALQSCDCQLTQLRAESEAVLGQLTSWQRLRDE